MAESVCCQWIARRTDCTESNSTRHPRTWTHVRMSCDRWRASSRRPRRVWNGQGRPVATVTMPSLRKLGIESDVVLIAWSDLKGRHAAKLELTWIGPFEVDEAGSTGQGGGDAGLRYTTTAGPGQCAQGEAGCPLRRLRPNSPGIVELVRGEECCGVMSIRPEVSVM
ncbi:hypothetical protein BCR44DRAFT_1053032 [Catenaria anguillulae PL171]|uniref:Uncharacterized protein n=1 Tax=Catenaria anguillulae PL171 TaxID=765915 RepID=A0A1Y2HR84_9FUNG|nr:hypothetical protein BCR44DRAFT_1053032 [Catenaria anguillulae PL171]